MKTGSETNGFPGSSAGKESTYNAGDSGSIPRLGRSPGEGIGYPFLGFPGGSDGKNLSAVRETWVQSLGWEDPLEKGKATYSSILAWRIPWTVRIVHGVVKSLDTTEQLSTIHV